MSNPTDTTAPDATPTDLPPAEQAVVDAGAGTDDAAVQDPLPATDPDADALAAFDKGIATVAEPAEAPRTAADVAAQAAEAAAGEPPAAAPAQAAAPAAAPAPATPVPDAETDQAVRDLGLKGRAEERFRELTGQVKELTPLRDALAKHQITEPAKIEEMVENAARAVEWENTVLASTATPEQFGAALNVIKAMNSADPAMQNLAFDAMLGEVVNLGRRLGREVVGLVDPLQSHPDLQQEVSSGDLKRERALEIAAQRATATAIKDRDSAREMDEQHRAAVQHALTDVQALNDQLKASDPDFARKLALLQPTLDLMRETVPPAQWRDRIERAYRALPALPAATPAPAAPARVPVGHMPVRPTGTPAAMQAKPKNEMEAFEMGLRSVRRD